MNPLGPYVSAQLSHFQAQRPPGAEEDVHIVASLADHVIERCSSPGELVLDPFAGFGAVLDRAIHLGREAIGVELLPERVAHIAHHTPQACILEGDARGLARLLAEHAAEHDLPALEGTVDLCFTSPPFMTANDHPANPLTAYELDDGTYRSYLTHIASIGTQVARLLKPGGYAVWNVANIRYRNHTTTLAWDLADVLSHSLHFLGETMVIWDELPHDFTGDYLLCFQKA